MIIVLKFPGNRKLPNQADRKGGSPFAEGGKMAPISCIAFTLAG
jgi:hypothetical protein